MIATLAETLMAVGFLLILVAASAVVSVAYLNVARGVFRAARPDDPTDPEPAADDFPIPESFVPLSGTPARYLEWEDEYLAAGGNDNPDTDTF